MESKGKRGFPRLFKGLRSLQCQESGAAEKTNISSLYLIITMTYMIAQGICDANMVWNV